MAGRFGKAGRLGLVVAVCAPFAVARAAAATAASCNVDARGADGEQVLLTPVATDGKMQVGVSWRPAPNPADVTLAVGFWGDAGARNPTIDAVSVDGTLKLPPGAAPATAVLRITSGTKALQAPVQVTPKTPWAPNGSIFVYSSFYSQWPQGRFLADAITGGSVVQMEVLGGGGEVFSRTTYDFGRPNHRVALLAQARAKLAAAQTAGCRLVRPLVLPPPPPRSP